VAVTLSGCWDSVILSYTTQVATLLIVPSIGTCSFGRELKANAELFDANNNLLYNQTIYYNNRSN
jgi:hypothetical protein